MAASTPITDSGPQLGPSTGMLLVTVPVVPPRAAVRVTLRLPPHSNAYVTDGPLWVEPSSNVQVNPVGSP